ncbi:hypothetical protein H0H92_002960, partial [Tricholoma furcatifolium]
MKTAVGGVRARVAWEAEAFCSIARRLVGLLVLAGEGGLVRTEEEEDKEEEEVTTKDEAED